MKPTLFFSSSLSLILSKIFMIKVSPTILILTSTCESGEYRIDLGLAVRKYSGLSVTPPERFFKLKF